jgi:hypothetical protein
MSETKIKNTLNEHDLSFNLLVLSLKFSAQLLVDISSTKLFESKIRAINVASPEQFLLYGEH